VDLIFEEVLDLSLTTDWERLDYESEISEFSDSTDFVFGAETYDYVFVTELSEYGTDK